MALNFFWRSSTRLHFQDPCLLSLTYGLQCTYPVRHLSTCAGLSVLGTRVAKLSWRALTTAWCRCTANCLSHTICSRTHGKGGFQHIVWGSKWHYLLLLRIALCEHLCHLLWSFKWKWWWRWLCTWQNIGCSRVCRFQGMGLVCIGLHGCGCGWCAHVVAYKQPRHPSMCSKHYLIDKI